MEDATALAPSPFASPYNFRRTQSCRVPQKGCQGMGRKGSRCARSKSQKKGTLCSMSSLTLSQRQALLSSWRLLRPQTNSMFRKILLELEIASPKVKQIFYKAALVDAFNKEEENIATMDVHIRIIVKFFDELLSNLDDEAELIDKMKKMGACHAVLARSCNFTGDIWEKLGEIAMQRICTHESVQTREAARAWRILIACLTDELRSGYEGEIRVQRKSSSTDHLETDECEEDLDHKLRQLRLDFNESVQQYE